MMRSGDTWAKSFAHYIFLCTVIDGRLPDRWTQVIDELQPGGFHKERARTPSEATARPRRANELAGGSPGTLNDPCELKPSRTEQKAGHLFRDAECGLSLN